MKEQTLNWRQTLQTTGRLICFGMPLMLFTLAGSALVSLANYLYNLFGGVILRNALLSAGAVEGGRFYRLLAPVVWIAVLALLCRFFGHMLNVYGGYRIFEKQYGKVVAHWLHVKEECAQKRHTGEAMTQLTYDLEEVEEFYNQGFRTEVLSFAVQGIMAAATIAWVDWRLIFLSLAIGLLSTFVTLRFAPVIRRARVSVRAQNDSMTGVLLETVRGIATIRLEGMEDAAAESYEREAAVRAGAEWKGRKADQTSAFCSGMFSLLSMLAFLTAGVFLAGGGRISFSDILVAVPMQGMVTQMLGGIGPAMNYLTGVAVAGRRILETFALPLEDPRADHAPLNEKGEGKLEFQNVTFSYDGEQTVLKNCSFTIERGKQTALAAVSGGGKSTILKLIDGFYDRYEGRILLEGQELREVSLDAWRKRIVYLEQEAFLFDLSIRENIALGRGGGLNTAADDEIVSAAKEAGAHEFIIRLPDGYDTNAGEMGNRISGGQRQRIAIARAFLSEAPIVLLDEPTSALDAENEAAVIRALKKLSSRKTVILTSHRFSTLKGSDRIIVLDRGAVAESGRQEELMAAKGLYYELARAQEK